MLGSSQVAQGLQKSSGSNLGLGKLTLTSLNSEALLQENL